jgi:hypothetical protein
MRGTDEEEETLRVLHALHAGLAAVLEGHQQAATIQASSSAVASVLVHPHLSRGFWSGKSSMPERQEPPTTEHRSFGL